MSRSKAEGSSFKRSVAQALALRCRIQELAQQERPCSFRAGLGFAVLARHTYRPGWRVHYLDAAREPVASVDAASYAEALYLAHAAGAELSAHPTHATAA